MVQHTIKSHCNHQAPSSPLLSHQYHTCPRLLVTLMLSLRFRLRCDRPKAASTSWRTTCVRRWTCWEPAAATCCPTSSPPTRYTQLHPIWNRLRAAGHPGTTGRRTDTKRDKGSPCTGLTITAEETGGHSLTFKVSSAECRLVSVSDDTSALLGEDVPHDGSHSRELQGQSALWVLHPEGQRSEVDSAWTDPSSNCDVYMHRKLTTIDFTLNITRLHELLREYFIHLPICVSSERHTANVLLKLRCYTTIRTYIYFHILWRLHSKSSTSSPHSGLRSLENAVFMTVSYSDCCLFMRFISKYWLSRFKPGELALTCFCSCRL